MPARGRIDLPLARDPKDGRKMRVEKDGKPSVTAYETLRRYPGSRTSGSRPETGRTHQIRVHLSAKGHPIAGDDFYGGATRWRGVREREVREALQRLARPLLHAERIVIEEMGLDVEAPLPADYEEILKVEFLRGERGDGGCEPGGAFASASVAPRTATVSTTGGGRTLLPRRTRPRRSP